MCGLAGFIDLKERSSLAVVRAMTDALTYRGPDDKGYVLKEFEKEAVGLGHRRLSILDLSPSGHQPYEYKHLHLIFNGEVYNFKELREKLIARGYAFQSNSDTEVVIKSFELKGIACVDDFIGMFSFALLDSLNRKMYLVRDRSGVKPMYWYWDNNTFLFGSEIKSFHQHPGFKKELDLDSIPLYFQYSYIPAPYTIYKNTHKLKPGHFIEFDLEKKSIHINKYWDVLDSYNKPKLTISYKEAEEELEQLLKSACEYRMVSDVPVGVFLSGGYDSSAVASILQSNRTTKLKTFTIGFEDPQYNEAEYAKKVAEYLGTEHTEYYCTQKEAFDIIPMLPDIYDEPLGDNSVIPTTLVSRIAAQKVKVALSADGGDEIFAGYPKLQMALNYSNKFPAWISEGLSKAMGIVNPDVIPFTGKLFNFSTRYRKIQMILSQHDPVYAMKVISQFNTDDELREKLSFPFKVRPTDFDLNNEINSGNDAINKMLAIDYRTFLVDNNLTKVDRATMYSSLEGREPLLDHRIIEFVAQLPSHYKYQPGKTKIILKNIVHKYIPSTIMERPKMGFLVPLTSWFRNELKSLIMHHLDEQRLKEEGIFNVPEIISLRDRYMRGEMENVQKLWHLLVFQMWKEKWG